MLAAVKKAAKQALKPVKSFIEDTLKEITAETKRLSSNIVKEINSIKDNMLNETIGKIKAELNKQKKSIGL